MLRKLKKIITTRKNFGFCPICDGQTLFVEFGPWLRDQYLCLRCRSIPRNRALFHVLTEQFPGYRSLRIHESSPCGPASARLARDCPGYVPSQYYPGALSGSVKDGFINENLEKMTFPDNSFDLTITQDVMEHVLHADMAFTEIARTLKPGGAHIFTLPLYCRPETKVRAVATGDGIDFLEEKEFHGNPVDAAGSLVVREWGPDLTDYIRLCSGMTTTTYRIADRKLGIDGEFLEVFVSRKDRVT